MSSDFIKGIKTKNGVKQYDYDYLGNKRTKLSQFQNDSNYMKKSEYNTEIQKVNDEINNVKQSVNDLNNYINELENKDLNEAINKYFALTATDKTFTVKFPLWETSQSTEGEKIDDNAGLVLEMSSDVKVGRNDYDNIPFFQTLDCNASVDEDGVRHITAIKGMDNYKDVGEVDVFVLARSRYVKTWEKDGWWYLSIRQLPKEGYKSVPCAFNQDGTRNMFELHAKYVCGKVNDKLYSSKNLQPARRVYNPSLNSANTDTSYNGIIDEMKKRGMYYCGGTLDDYEYISTMFYIMNATKNLQSKLGGCVSYSNQEVISIAENNVQRVILPKNKAKGFLAGSYVSVGDIGENTNKDRSQGYIHNIADSVQILSIQDYDENNSSIYLDVDYQFTTTPTTYVTVMPWRSGYSDYIFGRNGGIDPLISYKTPCVIQGVEFMVGSYETCGNAIMDIINENNDRNVYITRDCRKLSKNINDIRTNYKLSPYVIHPKKKNAWNYVTKMDFDIDNGGYIWTSIGDDGANASNGFADGFYADGGTSGQREFLLLGYLGAGAHAGLSCVYGYYTLGASYWLIACRLSINCVGVN